MSLQLIVTANQNFTDGVPITSTELNNGANPTVTIEDGAITSALLNLNEVVSAISPSLEAGNYLPWGSFQQERFIISGTVSCANLKRTPVHPGWYVLPDGIAVDSAASLRSSASESVALGRASIKVFGNSSLTSVNVGTYLPPGLAQMLYTGDVTFSCHIWNNTGTAFTPTLELYAGPTPGDEGDVSIVGTGTVVGSASCPNSEWKRVVWTFDASAVTNFVNGCHVRVKVTKASNVMDDVNDYFLLADAQIDPGVTTATTLKRAALPLSSVPPGCVMPWLGTSSTVPQGWLFCNGAEANRQRYAALFAAIGEAYGVGDGSTTFNLPDCRGRMLTGAEIAGSSQGRAEVAVSVVSSSGDTLTVASGAAAGLRLGMGAFNGGVLTGQTILALTDTTIQLSASVGSGISGTVYFSKLGAANAQTLGAAGAGLSGKRYKLTWTLKGCSVSGTTLTVPTVAGLACGMKVAGTGITAGTTIAAFLSATTLKLSASATATSEVTFSVEDAEGQAWERYQNLLLNPTILFNNNNGTGDTTFPTVSGDWTSFIRPGWAMSCADAACGIQSGTYVSSITSSILTLSTATGTATVGNYEIIFSGGAIARETTAQAAPTPGMLGVNYIIKV